MTASDGRRDSQRTVRSDFDTEWLRYMGLGGIFVRAWRFIRAR